MSFRARAAKGLRLEFADAPQKDCNEDAEYFAIHDNDFPIIVLSFVAIIQEPESLFDCIGFQPIRFLTH